MKEIKLDLGCGTHIKPGFTGIDRFPLEGVGLVLDIEKKKLPFQDNTVDEIYSRHFFEHVESPFNLILECHRVLKKGTKLNFIVPYFSNPSCHVPAHKTYWCYVAREHFVIGAFHKEPTQVWSKVEVELCWCNESWFWKILGAPFKWIARANPEFYEKRLCYIYPAYELNFVLTK